MQQYNNSIKGKLYAYFDGRLRLKRSTKGWNRTNCPDCGGHHTLGINLNQRKIHCFKCGLKITPIELLMQMERFETLAQAHQFLRIQQEYEYFDSYTNLKPLETKPVELPESFKLITQGTNAYAKAARHYLKRRGFNINNLALKGVGYCTKGEYAGYIIFPFYRQGKLVYFQGRIYLGAGPKMKNPPEEEFGIGKSNLIYNHDALYMYDKVYLVESITNAETLGDQAVAFQGKKLSEYQISNLIYSPCSKVVILLDDDAWEEAVQLAMRLVHYKRVKVVKMPEKQDVNDLGKKATLKLTKVVDYQRYMDLFKLKLNKNEGPQPTRKRIGPYKIDRRGA
jgi:DNA primase